MLRRGLEVVGLIIIIIIIIIKCWICQYGSILTITLTYCPMCPGRMPVLPKQPDEADFDRGGGVWSSPVTSSAWTGRRADDGSGGAQPSSSDDSVTYCCLPSGCPNYLSDPICLNDLGDAVKVRDLFETVVLLLILLKTSRFYGLL